ncbi:MAG: bifunctional diaminohydroxyphosphoribosylaminopyrimidine deaminase/5-amino-6-(5-phosphoribosylamino)uracil reductase RibD [Planctomycetota bacterium]|nr:bifunctional diaminohydroxyphosphoribosylaminopyrimidine deaminase/5-amino-6-(5-phosphoribosylamino)uracil reductase RibD [Planctomycetota bacterium]MDA1213413.1 bifunctional diaminohydroxyphosphoribosylaminopyrimidine deaminase/5-amino-6-(5-phosphoribosylamino)uracil reductase RibD [Planctomycetota bacterium]
MQYALDLACQGVGTVEPNPPVGAVIVDDELNEIASGFHSRFGGPHAEVVALANAGDRARGGTMFVTLEPCCHHGKTGPCTDAILAARIKKVVVARIDPATHAAGQGMARLREAGVEVETGLLERAARKLTAPFAKGVMLGQPYVHAKWAMSLDGKIATSTGHSQWISNETSRAKVHELRGRMDAIMVGIGTVLADDPLLTARPPGPRTAVRIVVDSHARLPLTSQLVQSAATVPVIVACTPAAPAEQVELLRSAGIEVISDSTRGETDHSRVSLKWLIDELGRRQTTNLLIEGGGELLGAAFDAQLIDECHVFIAPKIIGGADAKTPIGGAGMLSVPDASFEPLAVEHLADDIYIHTQSIAAVLR